MKKSVLRHMTIAATAMVLSGCSMFDGLFSDNTPPLPGVRVAILDVAGGLQADPRIQDDRIVLPAPYSNDSWPQSGGAPTHAMYHVEAGINGLSVAWRETAGSGGEDDQALVTSPVIADGMVFVLDAETRIAAHDLETGNRIWSRSAVPPGEDSDEGLGGGVGYYGGVLYASTGYGWVVAVDAKTGKRYWAKNMKTPLRAAPTISNKRVIVAGVDNSVHALDAKTGEEIWKWQGLEVDSAVIGAGSPAVAKNIVVVPLSNGDVVGLRLDNGGQLWSESLQKRLSSSSLTDIADVNGHPVIDRDMVFAIGHAGRMVALDLESGSIRWSTELGGTGTIWAGGDWLFALTNDNVAVAIERETGRIRWVTQLPRYLDPEDQEDPIFWTGPVLAGDRVLVTSSEEQILSLSPYDGAIIGKLNLPDPVNVAPAIAQETIVYLTDDGDLMALR